jgi:hypothetical protein
VPPSWNGDVLKQGAQVSTDSRWFLFKNFADCYAKAILVRPFLGACKTNNLTVILPQHLIASIGNRLEEVVTIASWRIRELGFLWLGKETFKLNLDWATERLIAEGTKQRLDGTFKFACRWIGQSYATIKSGPSFGLDSNIGFNREVPHAYSNLVSTDADYQ